MSKLATAPTKLAPDFNMFADGGTMPWTRTPVEVWEQIIFFAVTFDASSNPNFPIFDARCTPSTYLAFKRTCGDHNSHIYSIPAYTATERTRRTLRLVCRSWNSVASQWQLRRRWLRLDSSKRWIRDEVWKGALRIEVGKWSPDVSLYDPEQDVLDGVTRWIKRWKEIGSMHLQRLELLRVTAANFQGIFAALCDASAALSCLQSLSIYIPNHYLGVTRRLSRHFPQLLHLTLDLSIESDGPLAWDVKELEELQNRKDLERAIEDTLDLPNLETLLLFSRSYIPTLSNWHLPNLQHVHTRPTQCYWDIIIHPFLLRHASTIQSLDLDDSSITYSGGLTGTTSTDGNTFEEGFWDNFMSLQLLRCALQHATYANLPGPSHPLRYLVDTDPIGDASTLVHVLKPWVDGPDGSGGKHLESIVLYGSYLSRREFDYDRGEVQRLLRILRWNGTKLCNPAGKLWIETL